MYEPVLVQFVSYEENIVWIRLQGLQVRPSGERHDIQHNDIQHNDIHHNELQQIDIQHNDL